MCRKIKTTVFFMLLGSCSNDIYSFCCSDINLSLFKHYGAWMTSFLINPYFIFFPKFLYLLSRNWFTIKNQIFTFTSKSAIILSRPYLRDIFLKTRTKLRKSFKSILNFCKPQIVFKSQRKLANVF